MKIAIGCRKLYAGGGGVSRVAVGQAATAPVSGR